MGFAGGGTPGGTERWLEESCVGGAVKLAPGRGESCLLPVRAGPLLGLPPAAWRWAHWDAVPCASPSIAGESAPASRRTIPPSSAPPSSPSMSMAPPSPSPRMEGLSSRWRRFWNHIWTDLGVIPNCWASACRFSKLGSGSSSASRGRDRGVRDVSEAGGRDTDKCRQARGKIREVKQMAGLLAGSQLCRPPAASRGVPDGWCRGARTEMLHQDRQLLPRDLASLELGHLGLRHAGRAVGGR